MEFVVVNETETFGTSSQHHHNPSHVAPCPLQEAPPGSVVLLVHGMTCDGCVEAVTFALKAVPGVLKAETNLATRQVCAAPPLVASYGKIAR